jgi:hypothetical protein
MRPATTQCACGVVACSAVIVLRTVRPVLNSSSTSTVVPPTVAHAGSLGYRRWSLACECSSSNGVKGTSASCLVEWRYGEPSASATMWPSPVAVSA